MKATVGLECRVRLPSRILGLGQEWTEAKSRCPARRRATIRKEQLTAGVWSRGAFDRQGYVSGTEIKRARITRQAGTEPLCRPLLGDWSGRGEMRLLGGGDSDDPGEFSFCVTERSPSKGHLWLRGSIWEKDRVRCAVPCSDAACEVLDPEAISRPSADAAYNNVALIGQERPLKSVLVAGAPQFADVGRR